MFEKKSPNNDFSFTLTMRQLSLAVAGIIAFSFFIFISGYFLGQKRAAEDFAYRADQDSLADQIYSSMCVLYDPKEDEDSENGEEAEVSDMESAAETTESSENKDEPAPEIVAEPVVAQKQHRAILSGFPASLLENAKQMVSRLTKRGYPVELVEHTSTQKKISKKWYQVVTKPYSSKEELEKIKPQLAKIGQVKEQSIDIV